MEGDEIRATVEASMATELDRLGSDKLLIALTAADLTATAVLRSAAANERMAARAFETWRDDEPTEAARDAFAEAAESAMDRSDRIVDRSGVDVGSDPGDAALDFGFERYERTIERAAAGCLAWPLVGRGIHQQAVSFFINEADEATTDVFRGCRAEVEAFADEGAALLSELCADEADTEAAVTAAESTIEAAYDDYERRLEELGMDPRPVC